MARPDGKEKFDDVSIRLDTTPQRDRQSLTQTGTDKMVSRSACGTAEHKKSDDRVRLRQRGTGHIIIVIIIIRSR